MRTTVNISLPKKLKENIDKTVQKGNYSSRSEFIRSIIRRWQEDKVVRRIYESKTQADEGKAKKLSSIDDLS